jgi:hypothetical protein
MQREIELFNPTPIAAEFWMQVGYEEEFPRNLRTAVAFALPASIVLVPALSASAVESWLRRRDITCSLNAGKRFLRGCLIANKGHGLIFVDGTMPADEMRATIAHETAHFLHHYLRPRSAAIKRLGDEILRVLDGERSPSPREQLAGALRGVTLGVNTHLLSRTADGAPLDDIKEVETEADLIGFELLAPCTHVLRHTKTGESRRHALLQTYGLPVWAADVWSGWLDNLAPTDPLIRRLKAARRCV